jgi:hypothetical protein
MTAHRHALVLGLVLCAIAASQGIELFVNRVLRPDAEEITWIGEAVLAVGFVVVTWLWFRLRETRIALTDLERHLYPQAGRGRPSVIYVPLKRPSSDGTRSD